MLTKHVNAWFLCMTLTLALAQPVFAAREARRTPSPGDFAARQLLQRGQDLIDAREHERGVKVLETVIEQYPQSYVRHEAQLALGKHYLNVYEQLLAINYLRQISVLENLDEQEWDDDVENLYLESLYLTGVAYFQMQQYGQAFPVLRKITSNYPNTVWANQAFYYIGMCHFRQENWAKAIEALSVVGTFVDPDSPTVQYVEAGRRLYVKITDDDLPVLAELGERIDVEVRAVSGDVETIRCLPLSDKKDIFLGSVPTALGKPSAGDHTLQVVGGDQVEALYLDRNTMEGERDVRRLVQVTVVSSGSLMPVRGDYESRATAAFLGQPVFYVLNDADLDTTDKAESVSIRVVSRYKQVDDEGDGASSQFGVDLDRLFASEEDRYQMRDSVTLTLTEVGDAPVRTGRFVGQLTLAKASEDMSIDLADDVLVCALDDEIVATYIDDLHIDGESAREVTSTLRVVSELENRPRPTQYVVDDALIAAKKNLVEAEAYLELGKIFRSMGLRDQANERCDEGLSRVDPIIRSRDPLPRDMVEQAFKLRWELYLTKEDYNNAIATCQLFNQLYPESPFVDEALMRIALIKVEQEEYQAAIGILNRILNLQNSLVKAEAQYRIAEIHEKMATGGADRSIEQYRLVAQRFPDSEYAGRALSKLVDYHIETNDLAQANDLLEQVFQDHPDAQFLDSMLIKWVLVAYRRGDFKTAHEKCTELIFQYPSSRFAERAKTILPQIEARLKTASQPES